jgi:hypothetical protein
MKSERKQQTMYVKNLLTVALLLFVAVSVGTLIARELDRQVEPETAVVSATAIRSEPGGDPTGTAAIGTISEGSKAETDQVVAYYFHYTVRCPTCRKIEQTAHEALLASFGDELDTGRLKWQPINVEELGNAHFVDDYDLTMPSLILVFRHAETQVKWTPLERTWELIHDPQAFISYVTAETRIFLEGR